MFREPPERRGIDSIHFLPGVSNRCGPGVRDFPYNGQGSRLHMAGIDGATCLHSSGYPSGRCSGFPPQLHLIVLKPLLQTSAR